MRYSYAASVKKKQLFSVERIAARNNKLLFGLTALFAKRPKVEDGQSSWPKYIKKVHLVFYESFNGRHNKYSDRFLLERRGDRSLVLLDIIKIFHRQLVCLASVSLLMEGEGHVILPL